MRQAKGREGVGIGTEERKAEKEPTQDQLFQRLAKLKRDMQDYEVRMSDSRDCSELGLFCRFQPFKKPSEDRKSDRDSLPVQMLDTKYFHRVSHMRNSLESRKREIRNLLTSPDQSPHRTDLPLTYSKVNTVESIPRLTLEGTLTDVEGKLRPTELRVDVSDLAEVKSEQARLREEMSEMRERLATLEKVAGKQPFLLAPEAEDSFSSAKDSKRTSCSRYSFGRPTLKRGDSRSADFGVFHEEAKTE